MRVLHVGWGFTPLRPGGLIQYAEDVMEAQAAAGHEVAYFFSGRSYPRLPRPRLKRWRRGAVTMFELVNAPIVTGLEHGTRDPQSEIAQPWIEGAFAAVLARSRPDVVHVQEFQGLPSSLLDVAAAAGVPTVMTLHDFFPLCTTLRLFDAGERICRRREIGGDCVVRNADAPPDAAHWVEQTVRFELARARAALRVSPRVDLSVLQPVLDRVSELGALRRRAVQAPPEGPRPLPAQLGPVFQRRREVNVERLGRAGRLIAQSARVAEIYRSYGVPGERMVTMPATLPHIEALRPRRMTGPPAPVVFATLNGCASASKGAHLVLAALRDLRARGLGGRFLVRVLGHVLPEARDELAAHPEVELLGLYGREDLDRLLDDVDVGLMPSAWEEALGFTGLELVAKGIPLVANPLGGIVEYAREGTTAWLNHALTGAGLGAIMARLIEHPEEIVELHERLVAARGDVLVPMAGHLAALDDLYAAVAAETAATAAASGGGRSRG